MKRLAILLVACSSGPAAPSAPAPVAAPAPDAAPVVEAPAEPAETPITWQHSHEVEPDSDGCKRLRLTVKKGDETLAAWQTRDDCEQDPDYDCKDSGEGCSTTHYELLGWVELGEHRFAWVKEHGEWHDNGGVQVDLMGYVCGSIKRVWSYSWLDPSSETRVALHAIDGDWKALAATETEPDGTTTEHRLAWSDAECRYFKARR